MPNPNGRLVMVLSLCTIVMPRIAFAASAGDLEYLDCDDCYKCVSYDANGCTQCEYDGNYCAAKDCPVCEEDGCSQDPNTCECNCGEEEFTCEMSYYFGEGGACTLCPDADADNLSPTCGIASDGVSDIYGCYKLSVNLLTSDYCDYSDSTGTYIYTENCYYNDLEIEDTDTGA